MLIVASAVSALMLAGPAVSAHTSLAQDQKPVEKPQDPKAPQGRSAPAKPAPQRLPPPEQQRRIGEQQQRLTQYGDQLAQQQRLGPQRGHQLQQQHRTAQFTFQQQYLVRMNDQQARLRNSDSYNYFNDPYFYTPATYRYQRAGRFYETNEYGATAMRQAVNFGYEEGVGAGVADRQDHWAFNYQESYAYQDGNFGYGGFYIDRDDYNYYFREGFRRGYDDGFYGRAQYGRQVSGHYSMIGGLLSVILGLQVIR